jgi:hypothetical protein
MGIHQGCPQVESTDKMNDRIQSLRPVFVGKTEVRAEIRRIGHNKKIAVTVLTYSPANVTAAAIDRRAREHATEAARLRGASCADCTILYGAEIRRNAVDSKGKTRQIRVRSATYYFAAVE